MHLQELGNVFMDHADWKERYADLIVRSGDLLTARLAGISGPLCLVCAEKNSAECHRSQIAEFLTSRTGVEVVHL